MEGRNVIYMTPEEVRNLDKSQIASMTMTSGDVLIINNDSVMGSDEFAEENVINQQSYELTSNVPGQNYILRTKKEKTVEEGEGVEKIEEKVEIEVEPQPETEANQKGEVLRGPDGKPLLNDILTGGELMEQEQPQNEQQPMAGEVEENAILVPQEGQYYEQPGVPEQNVDMNNNAYNEQLYPSEEPNNENVNYEQNVQEQYVEPNYDNNYQPDYEPMPNDVQQEGYLNEQDQYYPQEQPMNVPEEQQGYYPEELPQQQDYEQPMNVPQEQQGYYPEEQPQPQQPMNVPQEQQGYYPEELPPEQEPLEPQVMPVNEPPLQEPIQPPTQPPVQAPIQPPTQPPVQAPIQPPAKQPMRPPVQPKIPKRQIHGVPKGKVIIPSNQIKVPKVKMAFGINTPKILIGVGRGLPKLPFVPMGHHPHGPMGRPVHRPMVHPPHAMGFIPPVQQKKIVIVGPRGVAQVKVAKQIGAMMNVVNKVMTPMVGISAKRLGLRSTKPTTTQKDDVKQENVLRARRNDVNNYNEQQEEVLCPECANEEYLAQSGQLQYNSNTGTGFSDNYNFHEIVETSDNSKSYVVAKKGGITVSSDY